MLQASFHVEGSEDLLPPHAMPAAVRVCGKLAVLDYVLSRLLAAKHKVYMVAASQCHLSARIVLLLRSITASAMQVLEVLL